MIYYEIEAVDTLFFRDGQPYNMGETQNNVKSMFPPSPYTMAGALRAGLARKLGWTGGSWGQGIIEKLGDGNDLGPLKITGPHLQAGSELIFPVPRNLLARKKKEEKWKEFKKVKPGTEILSDQGRIRYPVLEEEMDNMKNILGFLTSSDMKLLLWEDDISRIEPMATSKVWKHEFNVGIKRDKNNLIVDEGGLFSRRLVRLGEDIQGSEELDIKIVSGIEGIEIVLDEMIMLGGESKAAFIKKIQVPILPKPPTGIRTLYEFIAVLITPANLDVLTAGEGITGFPNHVNLVSVCADRPIMIGGWDFRKGPLPLKPHLKAGSVLFCKSEEGIVPENLNGKMIGNNTEFGFGQILIGKW